MDDEQLRDEVIKLIAAYRHTQVTRRGQYFIEQRIDSIMDILSRDPETHRTMCQLGLTVDSNGHRPTR